MSRLFAQHILRKVQSLDGAWSFRIDPEDQGEAENWQISLPEGKTVMVPSVWNT